MNNIDTIREALDSKFKDSQWVAYEASNGDTDTFETYDQAKAWLDGFNDDGISEETEQGYSYIAKITHRTAMEITDRKENYHQHTDSCGALTDECDEETWPYDGEYDYVGRVDMVTLAALSTIEADAKPQEPSEDAFDLVCKIREVKHGLDSSGDWVDYCVIDTHQAAALIQAHDDAIRRKCAERAVRSFLRCMAESDIATGNDYAVLVISDKIRSAILSTEPARDSLPETKSTGGANTLPELISLLEIARDNKTGISLDWVEIGIALRNLAEPAREMQCRCTGCSHDMVKPTPTVCLRCTRFYVDHYATEPAREECKTCGRPCPNDCPQDKTP